MSETEKATAERYRDTAEEIRLMAQRTPEIRIELFDLADRLRSDGRARRTTGWHSLLIRTGILKKRRLPGMSCCEHRSTSGSY